MTERRGPLADSYSAAVALVVCALVPFLTLTAALVPLTELIGKDLHLGEPALELTIAMSDAAYAFGTVLAVQFAQHLPARRMLIVYVAAFVAFALLAAWAPTRAVFIGAFVGEGLCTNLMLIAAVPPLVTGFGADRIMWTGAIMNLCIFGAVAAGPTIGELEASWKSWRSLFWAVSLASLRAGAWICCGLAAGGTLGAVALFLLNGARLQRPDLETWQEGESAWESPPLRPSES